MEGAYSNPKVKSLAFFAHWCFIHDLRLPMPCADESSSPKFLLCPLNDRLRCATYIPSDLTSVCRKKTAVSFGRNGHPTSIRAENRWAKYTENDCCLYCG